MNSVLAAERSDKQVPFHMNVRIFGGILPTVYNLHRAMLLGLLELHRCQASSRVEGVQGKGPLIVRLLGGVV